MINKRQLLMNEIIENYNYLSRHEWFESDQHLFFTARKRVIRENRQSEGLIRGIHYDEFAKVHKEYIDSLTVPVEALEEIVDDKYKPKTLKCPDVHNLRLDLLPCVDSIETLDDVDNQQLHDIGLWPYINHYALTHCRSFSSKDITTHLYFYAPIRRIPKSELFTEIDKIIKRYNAYLSYQEGDNIFREYSPSREEMIEMGFTIEDAILACYESIYGLYSKYRQRFSSPEAKFEYARDEFMDSLKHKIYFDVPDTDGKKFYKVVYLLVGDAHTDDFLAHYESAQKLDTLRSMIKMRNVKNPCYIGYKRFNK